MDKKCMLYRCKDDIIIFETKLASKGDIVEKDQVLENGPISIQLDSDFVENEKLFEKLNSVDLKVTQFEPEKEEIEKEWILELKVTTTRKKLRLIEKLIHEEVPKLL